MTHNPTTKRCSRCKKWKPFSAFNKNKSQKNGLYHYCKNCLKKYRQTQKIKHNNIGHSSYRGVSYTYGRPQAQIKVNGRMIYLGLFATAKLAAEAYDEAAKKYHGTKAKLNFTDRLITVRQEQIYRLCSPDFYNLTYEQAGMLLGISDSTVCLELKRVKKKCPSLFPLYHRPSNLPMYVALDRSLYYQPWMDDKIIMKF